MKLWPSFSLLFGLIFAILTCSENLTSVSSKPDKVTIITGTADTTIVERGIDAIPEDDAIFIQWYPLEDQNLKHYEIWRYNDAVEEHENIAVVSIDDSTYIDQTVAFYVKYFYYVIAVNEDNKKGESSDTLSYTLLKKAIHLNPQGEIPEEAPQFSWEDPNGSAEYILRVYDPVNDECVWLTNIASSYSDREAIVYNLDNSAKYEKLEKGKEYYWRIDVVGSDTYCGAGSESAWSVIHIREN